MSIECTISEGIGKLSPKMWSTTLRLLTSVPGIVRIKILLAERLFHVNAVSRVHDQIWDETTLALRSAVREYLRDGDRVLDLGTGDLGCVAVYCSNLRRVDVLGVDINESYIENARRVAVASGKDEVLFQRSDWLSNVPGMFDLVCGNVPYVPTSEGLRRKDSTLNREVWDGGPDGCRHALEVLRQVSNHLSDRGRLLLGVNRIYVPRDVNLAGKGRMHGLELEEILTSVWNPAEVYVFRRAC